ncbi:MAG: 6-phosphogluconolactonase [Granulosicoccus sp.]
MSTESVRTLCEKAGISWQEADNATALAARLAQFVADSLQANIDEHGQASLVVSGGSTPAPVFKQLSQASIDWTNVAVTLADERWVPPGHADSNESLVRNTLLVGKASGARFVSLFRDGVSPENAVDDVAREIETMTQPFTVTILGMGNDGHTASLFPDAPEVQLRAAMMLDSQQSVAVLTPPSVNQARITLTRAALLNSTHRILHMTGEGKRQVLTDALISSASDGQQPGEYTEGLKPIIGLLTSLPEAASVFWSQ